MTRYWTFHWQNQNWRPEVNDAGEPIWRSGSNLVLKRQIAIGDVAYIVSMRERQLLLGGRMTVRKIMTRDEAVRFSGYDTLNLSKYWIVDPEQAGTPLHLYRRLHSNLTSQLRFHSKDGPISPYFINNTDLDVQATRGIRQLTEESAHLLDRIIALTDSWPQTGPMLTVTAEMLDPPSAPRLAPPLALHDAEFQLPEELPVDSPLSEGARVRIEINRYERDPEARRQCIAIHGTRCWICDFDFGEAYGPSMAGLIHVHHLQPLSQSMGDRVVDPAVDLRPVCPNCHAVIHHQGECRSLEAVRAMKESAQPLS